MECDIPDFRSAGGVWAVFSPDEYATLEVFMTYPEKAWRLYRALGASLLDKQPGRAHLALAALEQAGRLQGIITQNIDGLHTSAGSKRVIEVHGNFQSLRCLSCGYACPAERRHLAEGLAPRCPGCGFVLKPDIVLFGELVRDLDRVESWLPRCDLLLVIGTSAQVFPAAGFPYSVRRRGGAVFEFNREATALTAASDFVFQGSAGETVCAFAEAVLAAA